jgi:hypothetical protein
MRRPVSRQILSLGHYLPSESALVKTEKAKLSWYMIDNTCVIEFCETLVFSIIYQLSFSCAFNLLNINHIPALLENTAFRFVFINIPAFTFLMPETY